MVNKLVRLNLLYQSHWVFTPNPTGRLATHRWSNKTRRLWFPRASTSICTPYRYIWRPMWSFAPVIVAAPRRNRTRRTAAWTFRTEYLGCSACESIVYAIPAVGREAGIGLVSSGLWRRRWSWVYGNFRMYGQTERCYDVVKSFLVSTSTRRLGERRYLAGIRLVDWVLGL